MPPRSGSLNKSKERLFKALAKEFGDDFDPIMEMSKHASFLSKVAKEHQETIKGMTTETDPETLVNQYTLTMESTKESINAWDKVAPYVAAKLKQVEIIPATDDDDNPLEWKITVVKPTAT